MVSILRARFDVCGLFVYVYARTASLSIFLKSTWSSPQPLSRLWTTRLLSLLIANLPISSWWCQKGLNTIFVTIWTCGLLFWIGLLGTTRVTSYVGIPREVEEQKYTSVTHQFSRLIAAAPTKSRPTMCCSDCLGTTLPATRRIYPITSNSCGLN